MEFLTVEPASDPVARREIVDLLASCGLDYEKHIEFFVTARQEGRLGGVACAGFQKGIIKDVAICQTLRGSSISLRLVSEVTYLAHSQGYQILFVYTEPHNADFFLAAASILWLRCRSDGSA